MKIDESGSYRILWRQGIRVDKYVLLNLNLEYQSFGV